jgi:hypothetical protein
MLWKKGEEGGQKKKRGTQRASSGLRLMAVATQNEGREFNPKSPHRPNSMLVLVPCTLLE